MKLQAQGAADRAFAPPVRFVVATVGEKYNTTAGIPRRIFRFRDVTEAKVNVALLMCGKTASFLLFLPRGIWSLYLEPAILFR